MYLSIYLSIYLHIYLSTVASLLTPWLVLVKLRANCSSSMAASSRGAVTSTIVTSNSVISRDSHSMLSGCVRVRRGDTWGDTWARGVKTRLTWRLGRVLETGLHQAGCHVTMSCCVTLSRASRHQTLRHSVTPQHNTTARLSISFHNHRESVQEQRRTARPRSVSCCYCEYYSEIYRKIFADNVTGTVLRPQFRAHAPGKCATRKFHYRCGPSLWKRRTRGGPRSHSWWRFLWTQQIQAFSGSRYHYCMFIIFLLYFLPKKNVRKMSSEQRKKKLPTNLCEWQNARIRIATRNVSIYAFEGIVASGYGHFLSGPRFAGLWTTAAQEDWPK